MAFNLSQKSLDRLNGVDERLQRVVKRAIQLTKQDFMVLEGVRTRQQCMVNYGKGRTITECVAKDVPAQYANPKAAKVTWLNDPFASKHVNGKAVDLVPYPVDWNDLKKFDVIAQAMLEASKELGIAIRWGADWNSNGRPRERGESDSPHFEI